MESKIFMYENDEIKITWDQKRCIHAKECIHGQPEVFDISKKPWIDPDSVSEHELLRQVIERCPSGALHYHFKLTAEEEQPPAANTVQIIKDGPVYIHGDIKVVDMEDKELFRDTRLAFCRCGASSNKPLCDNSHIEAGFEAPTFYNPERLELEPREDKGGPLMVKLVPNGPFVLEGNYEVHGEGQETTASKKKMSFCRCGSSTNKPFCDGSHKQAGFTS